MLALLLVNTDDFCFVFPEQLAAAVVLCCVVDRITNTTQKCMHLKLTIPCIYCMSVANVCYRLSIPVANDKTW